MLFVIVKSVSFRTFYYNFSPYIFSVTIIITELTWCHRNVFILLYLLSVLLISSSKCCSFFRKSLEYNFGVFVLWKWWNFFILTYLYGNWFEFFSDIDKIITMINYCVACIFLECYLVCLFSVLHVTLACYSTVFLVVGGIHMYTTKFYRRKKLYLLFFAN